MWQPSAEASGERKKGKKRKKENEKLRNESIKSKARGNIHKKL